MILRLARLFCIMILLSLFSSCKTTKGIVEVEKVPLETVIKNLKASQYEYKRFSSNAKIKFNGEDFKIGGRSRIIMIKDSVVMMTFKKIGIEGARALIRSDSTWILYRQENLYQEINTATFLLDNQIFASFGDAQDLLVGNVPIPLVSWIRIFESREFHQIEFIKDQISYQYWINDDFTIYKIVIKDNFGRTIHLSMQDYNENKFATKKEIELVTPGKKTAKISLKFSKVEFDKTKNIRFEIPNHYTRLH